MRWKEREGGIEDDDDDYYNDYDCDNYYYFCESLDHLILVMKLLPIEGVGYLKFSSVFLDV